MNLSDPVAISDLKEGQDVVLNYQTVQRLEQNTPIVRIHAGGATESGLFVAVGSSRVYHLEKRHEGDLLNSRSNKGYRRINHLGTKVTIRRVLPWKGGRA